MDKRVIFVLTIFAVLFELQALICPPQFTPVAGKCIFVSRNKVNWYAADRKCRKLGGSLMVFDSEYEQITITAHLLTIGVPFTGRWQDCIWKSSGVPKVIIIIEDAGTDWSMGMGMGMWMVEL
ncbi:snaclec bothrojaracin subunit beta-like [Drosophila santomea]|uniref:snaclec bothrojaracin subunit beta-like n=1 Tax=Drosophila santomea TaxID=129105 RepID=UPI0019540F07|nr:snaclec bothrojaracin subunit beta-like [Drosophila santomea]